MEKTTTVFVLGGSGFVGSYLLPKLNAKGFEITVLTRQKSNIPKLEKYCKTVIVGDLLKPEEWVQSITIPQQWIISLIRPDFLIGGKNDYTKITNEITKMLKNAIELAKK